MTGEREGEVAIVTGGSRGTGKALAVRLVVEGAAVCVTGRCGEPGSRSPGGLRRETVGEIRAAGGRGRAIAADLPDPSSDRSRVLRHAEDELGAPVLHGGTNAMLDRITTGAAMELYDGIAANAPAPEAAVLTENAASVVSLPERAIEPVEAFAEGTLALCTCDPRTTTGRITYDLSLLDELRRPVRTLDGKQLVPRWQPGEIDRARLRRGYLAAG